MRQGCVKDDSSLVSIDPVSNIRDYAIDSSMATDYVEKIAQSLYFDLECFLSWLSYIIPWLVKYTPVPS
jgi:hypothetical protein